MDIVILKTEIDVDPLGRVYSGMTDAEIVISLNVVDRPAPSISIEEAIKFLLMDNTYKTDDGDDTQARSIWQRMKELVSMAVLPSVAVANPWGSSSLGNITEIQQVKTHQLLEFFTLSAQGALSVDLSDSNLQGYLQGARLAGCMSAPQEVAFLALMENRQSRASELGLGQVREGHVQKARI